MLVAPYIPVIAVVIAPAAVPVASASIVAPAVVVPATVAVPGGVVAAPAVSTVPATVIVLAMLVAAAPGFAPAVAVGDEIARLEQKAAATLAVEPSNEQALQLKRSLDDKLRRGAIRKINGQLGRGNLRYRVCKRLDHVARAEPAQVTAIVL